MTLRFRNIDTRPEQPVAEWPGEAVLSALERGSLDDWRRLVAEIGEQPWGEVARKVEQSLEVSAPYGVARVMRRAIERARNHALQRERDEVAAQVQELVQSSGLSKGEFAARIGTSASRLSTYMTGKVIPSATLLLRMQKVAQSSSFRGTAGQE